MELRSGTVVASGYASAEAARAACMGSGQARAQLGSAAAVAAFAGAARGVLSRWTALRLAVENDWGGDGAAERAAALHEAVVGWFCAKGDHYADELEDHLTEYMEEDFDLQAEDGSPGEVARVLVAAFEAVCAGDGGLAQRLAAPVALTPLERCARDESDRRWTLEHGGGAAAATAAAAAGRVGGGAPAAAGPAPSPDELALALGGAALGGAEAMAEGGEGEGGEGEPLEEGWERAPGRRSGGRRGGGRG